MNIFHFIRKLPDGVVFFFIVYSSVLTLLVLWLLTIYLRKKTHSGETQPEDIQKLNRASLDNQYIENPSINDLQIRIHSAVIKPNRVTVGSEYDTSACCSKPSSCISKETQPLEHQYEEIQSHHYEKIVEEITEIYNGKNQNKTSFFADLVSRIKVKSPELYQIIYDAFLNHQYEAILEKETKKPDCNSEEDTGYATYTPKITSQHFFYPNQSSSSFGSTDHLKYLEEDTTNNSDSNASYLEAKQFNAKDGCPDELKKLLSKQSTSGLQSSPSEDNILSFQSLPLVSKKPELPPKKRIKRTRHTSLSSTEYIF